MRPVWIVGYPRTGSRLLTSYLNSTGSFNPLIDEWLGPKYVTENLLPPYSVVHSHHFISKFSFGDKPLIEKSLPGIRYIWLRRRDLVATAVSTFIARQTSIYWAKSKQDVEQHSNLPVRFGNGLFTAYQEVRARDEFWKFYLTEDDEYITTYYEDIAEDLLRICDFLGIDTVTSEECEYHKLQHPMTEELCRLLQDAVDSKKVEYSWPKSHFEQPIPLL